MPTDGLVIRGETSLTLRYHRTLVVCTHCKNVQGDLGPCQLCGRTQWVTLNDGAGKYQIKKRRKGRVIAINGGVPKKLPKRHLVVATS